MDVQEFAMIRELENRHGEHWGTNMTLGVLVAAVIIIAIVYNWTKNCNEKVAFATGLATLNGKVECITPQVATLNNQMYGAAQTFAGLVVGVNDMKENYSAKFDALNNTVFWNPANQYWDRTYSGCQRSGCGCSPNRVFAQTQTYTPSTSQVTVTETCGNDRC